MSVDFNLWRMPSLAKLRKDESIDLIPGTDRYLGLMCYGNGKVGVYSKMTDDGEHIDLLKYVGGSDDDVKEVLWHLWEKYGTMWYADCAHDPVELFDELDRYPDDKPCDCVLDEFHTRCMLEMMDVHDPRRKHLEEVHAEAEKKCEKLLGED